MAGPGEEAAEGEEPKWLMLYRARAPANDVAAAWLEGLSPDERQKASEDAPAARASLRHLIVDSECPEVRADAADGWKYTGGVLRAADAVLGIPPPKTRWDTGAAVPRPRPAADGVAVKGAGGVERSGFRPRLVLEGGGKPGSLGLWWSDFETAKQAERLQKECGITHRLNLAQECVGRLAAEEGGDESALLPTDHIPMVDQFDPDRDLRPEWPAQLEELLAKLRKLRDEGAVVNVSCQMGKNRSGAAMLLWLCSEMGWTLDAATGRMRGITPLACGNPHLMAAMAQFLRTDVQVPLNPAADGGGWVCISPPGSPRDGRLAAFENQAEEVIGRLVGLQGRGEGASPAGDEEEAGEVPADGDMGALFDDLSDVDD